MSEKKASKKIKKKRWFLVLAPQIFGERVLGESYVMDPTSLVGKSLSVNLMNITGDPKKQNTNAKFEILKVADAKGITELQAFEAIPSSLRRIVRRDRDKITHSFLCITADKRIVRVKPLIITHSKTHNSAKSEIRKKAKEMFIKEIYNLSLENMFKSIITYDMQRRIKAVLSKIYPVKNFEMTFIGIEKKKRFAGFEEALLKEAESLGAKEYGLKKEKEKEKLVEERKQLRNKKHSEKTEFEVSDEEMTEDEEKPDENPSKSEETRSEGTKEESGPANKNEAAADADSAEDK